MSRRSFLRRWRKPQTRPKRGRGSFSSISSFLTYTGTIEAASGVLTLSHAVAGTGAFKIDAGATLYLAGALATDAVSATETITAVIKDTSGNLSATAASGATVVGTGTKTMTLSGSLVAVNAELATVKYPGAALAAGHQQYDIIKVATTDSRGGTNTHQIAVTDHNPNHPSQRSCARPFIIAHCTAIARQPGRRDSEFDPLHQRLPAPLSTGHGLVAFATKGLGHCRRTSPAARPSVV